MLDKFDKKILITGIAGFIGSNVLCYMVKKYSNTLFIGVDKISYCSSENNFEEISDFENYIFVKSDITDLEAMDNVFSKYEINNVLHFAAYSHVDSSFVDPFIFTHNNVYGTHVLLEVAKKYPIQKFIHVSTDEVYGDNTNSRSDETSALAPTNPYSATKAAAEHIALSYYKSFNVPVIVTRGNNVYGPKQFPEKIIPKFILNLFAGTKCDIHGSGTQKRSFLYIDDVVKAFDIIFSKGVPGEIYNIGCDKEYSILDVLDNLLKFMKSGEEINTWANFTVDRLYNDKRYYISFDKLKCLGWEPEVDFDEGLLKTIEWYKNNPNNWI